MIVDVKFNIGKNWVQNNVYMSNERNWNIFHFLHRFDRFSLFFVLLFNFSAVVSFVTTTIDKLQFQSQVTLSQINVRVPILLKFKLYAVFSKWGLSLNEYLIEIVL